MTIDDQGGPAFPGNFDHGTGIESFVGMTLRDYFAGQALASVSLGVLVQAEGVLAEQSLADAAYRVAGAMLAERSKES